MPQEDDRLELRSPRVSDYASGISRPPTRAAEAAAAEAAAAEAAAASALQSTSRTATDHVSQASDGGSTEASLVSSGGPAAGPLERRGRYGSGRALERGGRHLPRQRRAGGARHDPRLLPIRLQAGVARLRAGRLYVHRRRAGRPHARHAPPQVKSELKSKQVKTMEVVPVFKRGRFDLLSGDPPPYPTTVQLLGEDGGVGHAVTIVGGVDLRRDAAPRAAALEDGQGGTGDTRFEAPFIQCRVPMRRESASSRCVYQIKKWRA